MTAAQPGDAADPRKNGESICAHWWARAADRQVVRQRL